MHERERHRIMLSAVQERAVVTVQDAMDYTGASEATIRRDIAALADEGRLRKVRGGAEAIHPAGILTARSFSQSQSMNLAQKGLYKELQSVPPGGVWESSFWIRPRGF